MRLCLPATINWKAFDCCAFFIELRQSAEGVDVLPDVPGDGGGGGDGSSGNNSDADDGGPAGLCLPSSLEFMLRTFTVTVKQNKCFDNFC